MGRHSSTPKQTRQDLRFMLVATIVVTTLAAFHLARYFMLGFWILVFTGYLAGTIWYAFFSEKKNKK